MDDNDARPPSVSDVSLVKNPQASGSFLLEIRNSFHEPECYIHDDTSIDALHNRNCTWYMYANILLHNVQMAIVLFHEITLYLSFYNFVTIPRISKIELV